MAPHASTPAPMPDHVPPPSQADAVSVANDNLNAVAWSQTAIEHELIYRQTYRDAQDRLLAALADPQWDALPGEDRQHLAPGLPPAIVLDIDETVLDNSPYQAQLVRHGGEYNEADWAAWCRQEAAHALPGAVAFTQFAAQHGVTVIYISNRAASLDQVTLANLRKVGLPVVGAQAFLGLGTRVDGCTQHGTEKSCRRRLIGQHYRVLMQFGDQLGDFLSAPAGVGPAREQAIKPYLSWLGERWFVLPNPTYGGWESALFDNRWQLTPAQRRALKQAALRTP